MLVLLGPSYAATDGEVEALVLETGLAPYDLRSRLRPGAWSVVRAVADHEQALDLAAKLRTQGFQCCALDSAVGHDTARRIAYLRGVDIAGDQAILRLAERTMTVPLGALLTIVRGDVHLGRNPLSASMPVASTSIRGATGSPILLSPGGAATELYRDSRGVTTQEVFVAADIHFVTVPWLARIDARDCEFLGRGPGDSNFADRLDQFIDDLAAAAHIRVDRHVKTSNLASHTAGTQRMVTPSANGPGSSRRGAGAADEHFDAYSRMIGEAERQTYIVR